jgi:hypothetical protein
MRGSIGRTGLKRGPPMHVAVVKATFDEDARVWYVESSDGSPHRDHRARLRPGSRSCVKNFGKPVRDRLFGAAQSFVCTSEPVVKRDKLSAERVG